jgi:hypothetical protein
MPPQKQPASKNPVTLVDYLAFGLGAVGGAVFTASTHGADLGHSIGMFFVDVWTKIMFTVVLVVMGVMCLADHESSLECPQRSA